MRRSTERILTTHTGSLPRPSNLTEMLRSREKGQPINQFTLDSLIQKAAEEVVAKQCDVGVDVLNDGELGKVAYSVYVKDRLSSFQHRTISIHSFAAYTGARRSEILRSQVDDFDMDADLVTIRERKRRKDRKGSTRHVPLHPNLRAVMERWFAEHPGGNFSIAPPRNMPRRKKTLLPANSLTPSQADHHFDKTLKGSKWSVIRGFHVLRHSFGSNLIRSGTVSSDIVAKWMGHTTMEMRELYQHLFPQNGLEQISVLR